MAERTVPQYARDQEAPAKEETRSQDAYVTPPVDIYETADGLVVKADLPGVTKDGLDLRVENNLLTIRGRAAHCAPGNLLYREYNLQNFFRQFELSDHRKMVGRIPPLALRRDSRHSIRFQAAHQYPVDASVRLAGKVMKGAFRAAAFGRDCPDVGQ